MNTRDADEAYRRLRADFKAAYMSDTKWREVFTALARAELGPLAVEWKFIDRGRVYHWGLPGVADLLPTRLADGRMQPVEYRAIEWLRFPRWRAHDERRGPCAEQELARVRHVLGQLGQLALLEEGEALRLLGYER